jgi:hypothetical protein
MIRCIINEATGSENSNYQQPTTIVACINTGIFPCDIVTFSRQQAPNRIELQTLNTSHAVVALYLRSKQPQLEDKIRDARTSQKRLFVDIPKHYRLSTTYLLSFR